MLRTLLSHNSVTRAEINKMESSRLFEARVGKLYGIDSELGVLPRKIGKLRECVAHYRLAGRFTLRTLRALMWVSAAR